VPITDGKPETGLGVSSLYTFATLPQLTALGSQDTAPGPGPQSTSSAPLPLSLPSLFHLNHLCKAEVRPLPVPASPACW
jgi:hypothetical protein